MKTEIPEFLLEMSNQINTQDNRITADPIWMVCYDKEYPTSEDYADHYQWIDCENEYHVIYTSNSDDDETEQMKVYLLEHDEDWVEQYLQSQGCEDIDECFNYLSIDCHDLPKGIEKVWVNKKQEIVKACLTESDANWFIKRKQHDYPKLYTYVYSMYFCPQMMELRKWIMSLTGS